MSAATGTFWEATDARSFSSLWTRKNPFSLCQTRPGKKILFMFVQFLIMSGDHNFRRYIQIDVFSI